MKRKRFTEEQIIQFLKEHEAGLSVADLTPILADHARTAFAVNSAP